MFILVIQTSIFLIRIPVELKKKSKEKARVMDITVEVKLNLEKTTWEKKMIFEYCWEVASNSMTDHRSRTGQIQQALFPLYFFLSKIKWSNALNYRTWRDMCNNKWQTKLNKMQSVSSSCVACPYKLVRIAFQQSKLVKIFSIRIAIILRAIREQNI